MVAHAAPPRQSAPAALSNGARVGGVPSAAPDAAAAPQFAAGASADGSHADAGVPVSPVATSTPKPALGVFPDSGPSGASGRAAGGASADGSDAGAGVPISPVATSAPKSALGVFPDGGSPGASAGRKKAEQRAAPRRMAPMPAQACRSRRSPLRRRSRHSACSLTADRPARQPGQRRTRHAILSTAPTNPRHGATFPRLSGATSGNATGGAAVIAIRSPGAAAPLPICCRSTTCCRSPRGVARTCST